jgi:hypothetical protein
VNCTTPYYEALCTAAKGGGHVLKLTRQAGDSWGLQVAAGPDSRGDYRAIGILFPDVGELDQHAQHLLAWLLAVAVPAE